MLIQLFGRFQTPSTLSYRERNGTSNSGSLVATPPLSGRSSPYQPYGSALGGHASASANSLHSLGIGSNGRDSLPRWQGHRSDELLESQNDEQIEGIGAKVKQLKAVSSWRLKRRVRRSDSTTQLAIGIGQEAKDSTIQLTQMVREPRHKFSSLSLPTRVYCRTMLLAKLVAYSAEHSDG